MNSKELDVKRRELLIKSEELKAQRINIKIRRYFQMVSLKLSVTISDPMQQIKEIDAEVLYAINYYCSCGKNQVRRWEHLVS